MWVCIGLTYSLYHPRGFDNKIEKSTDSHVVFLDVSESCCNYNEEALALHGRLWVFHHEAQKTGIYLPI